MQIVESLHHHAESRRILALPRRRGLRLLRLLGGLRVDFAAYLIEPGSRGVGRLDDQQHTSAMLDVLGLDVVLDVSFRRNMHVAALFHVGCFCPSRRGFTPRDRVPRSVTVTWRPGNPRIVDEIPLAGIGRLQRSQGASLLSARANKERRRKR